MSEALHRRSLRLLLIALVATFLVVLIGGFAGVRLGRLAEGPFLALATIGGALASLIGLLSLARPPLSARDIANLEVESLSRMAQLTKELEAAAQAKTSTRTEIEALELQRAQMEASVARAAQVLFLRGRVRRSETRLAEKLSADQELSATVTLLTEDYQALEGLTDEISRDPNARLIAKVIVNLRLRELSRSPLFVFFPTSRLAEAIRRRKGPTWPVA